MKRLICLVFVCVFCSCEDEISVDLATAPQRLVVDASLDWERGTSGSNQMIRLTLTAPYYDDGVPAATGATVYVTNTVGQIFGFEEETGTGRYYCSDFVPELGETYVLTVLYNGKEFTATETMTGYDTVTQVVQRNDGGFFNDEIELSLYYTDDMNAQNHYLARFFVPGLTPFPDYSALSDQFTNGNETFTRFSDEDLAPGDTVEIAFFGISRRYYDYMNKLLLIAQGSGGGPFSTAPANVRGNVVNTQNSSDYALGYFRLSEMEKRTVTIE